VQSGAEVLTASDFQNENHEKMNNDCVEVAKNEDSDAERYILPKEKELEVKVLMKDGSVRKIELEEYVKGCVFGEMPMSFEPQAIMAQSVAVRTFTLRQMTVKSKHKNADVCANPACCQNFADADSKRMSDENRKKLCSAVEATRGIVMVYGGEPINAVYHAASGDKTLSSEEVWGGRLDYLVSVDAPEGEKEIYSRGYGHRVGMSQHGANLLAMEGKSYREILKYYYSGISFSVV
jgi:stage II sporulation protein D